ncbi:hypothetical protein MC885_019888 [Smutsia gigantea]|nr:hypothetical protein MC885_019888 [Smutsia gigantea]
MELCIEQGRVIVSADSSHGLITRSLMTSISQLPVLEDRNLKLNELLVSYSFNVKLRRDRSWASLLTVYLVVTLQSNKVPVVQPSHAVHPLTPLITYSDEHFSPGSHPSHIPSDVNSKQGMSRHPPAPEIPTFYPLSPGGVGQITPPLGWQGQPVYPITGGFRQPYPSSLSVDTSMSRFSHHMIPGPPGPHTTGIPHPAIVTPQVKQERPHTDSDLMHVKPQHEQRKEQEPKRPHIKKPLNAFMLYMKEMRANVVAECTLKESAAINQILGRRWHALSREEQAKYYELARKERQLHMQLYPGWSARDNYEIVLRNVMNHTVACTVRQVDGGRCQKRVLSVLVSSKRNAPSAGLLEGDLWPQPEHMVMLVYRWKKENEVSPSLLTACPYFCVHIHPYVHSSVPDMTVCLFFFQGKKKKRKREKLQESTSAVPREMELLHVPALGLESPLPLSKVGTALPGASQEKSISLQITGS